MSGHPGEFFGCRMEFKDMKITRVICADSFYLHSMMRSTDAPDVLARTKGAKSSPTIRSTSMQTRSNGPPEPFQFHGLMTGLE